MSPDIRVKRPPAPRSGGCVFPGRAAAGVQGQQSAECWLRAGPGLLFFLGDDHHSFLAVAGDALRFARERALDELGEIRPGFV
jgi:hypothetical protein